MLTGPRFLEFAKAVKGESGAFLSLAFLGVAIDGDAGLSDAGVAADSGTEAVAAGEPASCARAVVVSRKLATIDAAKKMTVANSIAHAVP